MSGVGQRTVSAVVTLLDRAGIISERRFRRTVDLAWPRIITGAAIVSKQAADLAMVGIAVGTTGTAGLAFALAYWELVAMLGLGLAGGTISLVSQHHGSGDSERASLVVKQSIIICLLIATPLLIVFVAFAEPLIGLLGGTDESISHGAVYLVFVAPAVVFEMLNLIASRTYTGVGDTFTEMIVRVSGAILNVVLSAVLIFGFGMGVAGAAIGTTVSTGFVTVVMAWGMFGRSYGILGMEPSPVPISIRGQWLDTDLTRHLVEISLPEIGRKLAQGLIVFPLLWVTAAFGPLVVTAFEVGRRVRSLIISFDWGFALAASSLVGQHLGAGDEDEAGAYGAEIIRLSFVVHLVAAAVVIAFAGPIAGLFVTGPDEVAQTAVFIGVAAISAIGFGIDGTAAGALLGAGDTRLPFLASLIGRYVFALPAALLGILTPIGILGLYLAFMLETFVPAAINYGLFRTGRWKAVSRRYRTPAGTD